MAMKDQHIKLYKGDSDKAKVIIANGNDGMKPLNLDGAEVLWDVYHEPYHKVILSKSTMDGGVQIASASEGTVYLNITEADSLKLTEGGSYTHYVRVKDTFGQKKTVATGRVFIEK